MSNSADGAAPGDSIPNKKRRGRWMIYLVVAMLALAAVFGVSRYGFRIWMYFATPNVMRRMLPAGKLTKDYIYLKVLLDGDYRDLAMIDEPEDS